MRWKKESHAEFVERHGKWKKRFAWHPVYCSDIGKSVWLETFVERWVFMPSFIQSYWKIERQKAPPALRADGDV